MNRDLNEKMRIINKMINTSSPDEKSQKIEYNEESYYHRNTIEESDHSGHLFCH